MGLMLGKYIFADCQQKPFLFGTKKIVLINARLGLCAAILSCIVFGNRAYNWLCLISSFLSRSLKTGNALR